MMAPCAAWGASLIVAVVATGASARADDPAGHFVATTNMHLARDGARAVLVDHRAAISDLLAREAQRRHRADRGPRQSAERYLYPEESESHPDVAHHRIE